MSKKRRVRPFLLNAVAVRCPDCGNAMPLKVASLLGTLNTADFVLSQDLARFLFLSFAKGWIENAPETTKYRDARYRVRERTLLKTGTRCGRCGRVKPLLHWVVVEADKVLGPLCVRCLRYQVWKEIESEVGLSTDMAVLLLPGTPKTLRQARNVATGHPWTPDKESSPKHDHLLF